MQILESASTLIANFRGSTQSQQIEDDTLLFTRRAWRREIERAQDEYQQVSPALWSDESAERQNLEQVKKDAAGMIRNAERAYEQAQLKRRRADEARDAVVDPARRNLQATASPKIAELSRRLQTRRSNLRPEARYGADGVILASTGPSVQRAIDHLSEIIVHGLRAVELEALNDAELDARLQALEASIPIVEMEPV